jgi:aryl-alcohol dehydrogenase-like predicted oxidoreductase
MKYGRMGRTGLLVSKICLGTANFGTGITEGRNWGVVPEKEAHKIMDYAVDNGINFFDTANVYGGAQTRGLTETIIGDWFALGDHRRDKVVLSTKVARIMENDIGLGPNNIENLSIFKIRRHVEASLKRLQTDHLEMITMHKNDPITSWDEIWEGFERLVKNGKVDYVGASNHETWQIMKANEVAHRRNFMGIACEQHLYTPLARSAELEMFPMAADQGMGVTLFSPLFRGFFGIDAANPDKRPMSYECKQLFNKFRDKAEAYSKLCREIGESEANVTLAWELRRPEVTSVIVAPTSIEDLQEMLKCLEINLNEDVLKKIDAIFPPLADINPYDSVNWTTSWKG